MRRSVFALYGLVLSFLPITAYAQAGPSKSNPLFVYIVVSLLLVVPIALNFSSGLRGKRYIAVLNVVAAVCALALTAFVYILRTDMTTMLAMQSANLTAKDVEEFAQFLRISMFVLIGSSIAMILNAMLAYTGLSKTEK
jgi:hypothetical protein